MRSAGILNRIHGLTLLVSLLLPVALFAVPMPWLISNMNPAGETDFVRDSEGEILTGPFLVQLVLDVDRDGPNPPSTTPGSYGAPTGDDYLITSLVCVPEEGIQPDGAFVLLADLESDNPAVPEDADAYIRVFASTEPTMNTPFMDSEIFHGPRYPDIAQTVVQLPPGMTGYIGNIAPLLTALPEQITVAAGEEALINLTAEDDQEQLRFSVIADNLPGGENAVTVLSTGDASATVSWVPPFDAVGEHDLVCAVTDGQYTVTVIVPVTVTGPSDLPAAFHLAEPVDNDILWDIVGFSWKPSEDPDGGEITYSLIWASDPEFTDADSISGITDTFIIVGFDNLFNIGRQDNNIIPRELNRLNLKQQYENREDYSAKKHTVAIDRSVNETPLLPGKTRSDLRARFAVKTETSPASDSQIIAEQGLKDLGKRIRKQAHPGNGTTDELDIEEGDTVYWRVHAYDSDGNARASLESWTATAEIAEPPSAFHLLAPADNAELATLSPSLIWDAALDPDEGDTVRYELLWSLDGWSSIDTVRDIAGTSFGFTDPEVNSLPGAERFRDALFTLLENGDDRELNDLPDESEISWTVDAVDRTGLRSPALESWSFSVSVPSSPGGFNLLSPADNTQFSLLQPVLLTWSPSVDNDPGSPAVRYDVLATDDPEADDPVMFPVVAQGVEGTAYTLDVTANDDREWRWAVRAVSQNDTTWASANEWGWFGFAVSAPDRPDPFNLVGPADGDTVTTATPVFTWRKPYDPDLDDPLSFILYFSIDDWATTDSITGITDTVFIFPEEEGLGILHSTDFGNGGHSGTKENEAVRAVIPLETKTANGSLRITENEPILVQPVRARVVTPLFPGKEINTRSPRTRQVKGGQERDVSGGGELDDFPDSSLVSWRVRAQDVNSIGRWCTPFDGWSFTVRIDYPPTAFSLLTPPDGAEVEAPQVVFSWEESDDPNGLTGLSYTVFIADNPDFTNPDSAMTGESSVVLGGFSLGQHWWKVVAIDATGSRTESNETWTFTNYFNTVDDKNDDPIPTIFALESAYPNPFNPSVTVVLAVPSNEAVKLSIHDILGRLQQQVGPLSLTPGYHPVRFDLFGKPSGIYFIRLETSRGVVAVRKVMLLK